MGGECFVSSFSGPLQKLICELFGTLSLSFQPTRLLTDF